MIKRLLLTGCCVLLAVTCYAQTTAVRPITPATPDLFWSPTGAIGTTVPWRLDSTVTPTICTGSGTGSGPGAASCTASDNGRVLEFTNSGPMTATMPDATSGNGFTDGTGLTIQTGPGSLTLSRASTSNINGLTSLQVGSYQSVTMISRTGNWYATLSLPQPATQTGTTLLTSNMAWQTAVSPPPSNWTLVAHTAAGSTNQTSVTTPAINTTGADLLVLCVNVYAGSASSPTYTLSGSASNTWGSPAISSDYTVGSAKGFEDVYYIHNPNTSASHTFTVTTTAPTQSPAVSVLAWSGSVATPLDGVVGFGNTSATATISPGSITPSQANDLIVSFYLTASIQGSAPSISSPFVFPAAPNFIDASSNSMGIMAAYYLQGAAATLSPTWTMPVSSSAVATMAAFK